jgi:hypothetical protein
MSNEELYTFITKILDLYDSLMVEAENDESSPYRDGFVDLFYRLGRIANMVRPK